MSGGSEHDAVDRLFQSQTAFCRRAFTVIEIGHAREVARIRFRLLRLSETHGTEAVLTGFARVQSKPALTLR